ncbi:MAG: hypothetical protein NC400_13630 [Clostridium sp.]|nr:hypothetical protein [Clostridium sp.]
MENKGKMGLAIIFFVCLAALAAGTRLHWSDNATGGRNHKVRAMEIPEKILAQTPGEGAEYIGREYDKSIDEKYSKNVDESSDADTDKYFEADAAGKPARSTDKEFEGASEKETKEEFDDSGDSMNGRPDGESAEASDEEWERQFLEQYRGDFEKECQLEEGGIRFRMVVLDAALGSRWYGLLKSMDRGLSWQVVSSSPFGGDMGMGVDFTFLNETLGFATLMHNGGDEADLYVTEDGGKSYQPVAIQGPQATLEGGYQYYPYDYPEMPYEEGGKLYVLCGQGADGDYAGGDAAGMALFESMDGGRTFSYQYIKEGEKD